jgi:hypothetical protein
VHTAPQMRSRSLIGSLLLLPLFGCNDNTPSYPAIIIYENPQGPTGTGNTGNVGSGNTGNNPNPSGGSGNSSGGASNGGGSNDLYAHCSAPWSGEDPPVGKVQCDMDALTDDGVLTGDITANRTLTSGHTYLLKGEVRVMPGVTLTIEPCVKVIGENSNAVLVVLAGDLGDGQDGCSYKSGEPGPGGKIMAVGEPMAPIVFTSIKPKGQRKPGDWGGVILMGNAQNNNAVSGEKPGWGNRVSTEGLDHAECHGWLTDKFNDESTGELKYVRIEYASKQQVKDIEINGLTLDSLGRGTKLHYIMVANAADDCFEWFGGVVNADHLIALNCDDDMFDADQGYSGKGQFLFGRQYPVTTELDSRGFEIDGAPNDVYQPRTAVQFSNFTLCGGGPTDNDVSKFRDGIVLRKLANDIGLMNGFVTGFATSGVYVQADNSDGASMSFVDVFGNTGGLMGVRDVTNTMFEGEKQAWFFNQAGNTTADPDRFCNCWANPPVPVPGTPSKGTTPTGFDDESASYMGAFKDASAEGNWMRGAWVDWSSE